MSIEIKVPMLPESVADAKVLTWHKKAGDTVTRDETIVELETDKVVLEVPAPQDGVLASILEPEGSTVLANQILAIVEAQKAGKPVASLATTPKEKEALPTSAATVSTPDLSPGVRRLVGEHQVDVSNITGSGKSGRVLKEDVMALVKQTSSTPFASSTMLTNGRAEQRVPMSRLRTKIAERLVAAQQQAAMLTTFNEVNMQPIMNLREQYKEKFEKAYGVRLGFMSFFTKACVEALKRFPVVNASIDGNDIIYHGYYDIGVAVSTERGLVVPILRDADQLTMAQIEQQINDFAARARQNKLTIEEMQGGTFTITNGGVFGSLMSMPILNPPQVAILGMQKIEKRPIVENDQIVIRPMMYLSLSYDHRLIDGKDSVQFLVTIKECLEDPTRLLLGV